MTLKGQYSHDSCPAYLKDKNFSILSQEDSGSSLDRIRLHTDTLKNVCERLSEKMVSIAIIMDHMDWFDPRSTAVDDEVQALFKVLDAKGRVMLRSASKNPWYIKSFEKHGFKCKPVSVRYPGKCIDRVNMYASTWICQKITTHIKPTRRVSTLELESS